MRRFFLSFLILVMLAATMVCGCPSVAQASTHSHHESDSDHHHGNDSTAEQDCLGTDMQLPQQFSINKPDLKHGFHLDYIWANEKPVFSLVLVSNKSIRGPPPDWPDFHQTQLPILLNTQRLLI